METKITIDQAKQIYLDNNKRVIGDNTNGFVVLQDIAKVYGNRVQAVYNFNLSVSRNEFIVLVGPSGCGKSTTLRMIAGLEEITDGKLFIDNILANYLESKDRDIAMVFQSYALYPNMSVYDNMGFGLQVKGLPKEEIQKRVFRAAEILDLGSYLDRKPKELSGGQMQRVALGRAIVRDAKLFLMDEPLSNLDAKLRVQMRSEIVKLHREIGATTIYVTHDQTEAMTMADRIVIMNKGLIQQIGSPIDVYNNPANVFVATFIGNPPMNVFFADISANRLYSGSQYIQLPDGFIDKYRMFIQSRRAFFTDLKKKANCAEEKQLLHDIAELQKSIKKLPASEVSHNFCNIVNGVHNLSVHKGFVSFSAEQASSFVSDLDKNNISVLIDDLKFMEKLVKHTDFVIAGILKEVDSSNMRVAKQEVVVQKKRFGKKQVVETLEEENKRRIDEYINSYFDQSVMDNALVGIRPEDIYFDEAFSGNKSNAIDTRADLVELLGSEFCMHVKMFGVNLIVKRSVREVVSNGSDVTMCLDMDKVKIFDPVSGVTINEITNSINKHTPSSNDATKHS